MALSSTTASSRDEAKRATALDAIRDLFPGEVVETKLADGRSIEVRVFPLAFSQIRRYSERIAGAVLSVLSRIPASAIPTEDPVVPDAPPEDAPGADRDLAKLLEGHRRGPAKAKPAAAPIAAAIRSDFVEKAIRDLAPVVLADFLDLFEECVRVEVVGVEGDRSEIPVGALPHWISAAAVDVWLRENLRGEEKIRPWVAAFEGIKSLVLDAIPTSSTGSSLSAPPESPSATSSKSNSRAVRTGA